jgi:hypothetical protein
MGMRKFARIRRPQNISAPNKTKWAVDAQILLHAPTNGQSHNFWHIMTGEESRFCYNYDSSTMFARVRDEIVWRGWPTIGSKKVIVTIFFTPNRLLKVADLAQWEKYHKDYFINQTVKGINRDCNQGCGYRVTKRMKIQRKHCRVDNARKYCRQLAEWKLRDWPIHLIHLS